LIAGLFSGVFISGDQIRANTSIGSGTDRKKRTKGIYVFTLFGAPNFIVAIILTSCIPTLFLLTGAYVKGGG
jgi:hypothetical protein